MSWQMVAILTSAFISGMIAAEIRDWKIWVPVTALMGLGTGIAAHVLGVA